MVHLTRIAAVVAISAISAISASPQAHRAPEPVALALDAVLALRSADGAIPDQPNGKVVNADSNFLYLLTGLADQAALGGRADLWPTVESGLRWLAQRQWRENDPLPGAFPDALPLKGPGIPQGKPAVAAVGATSARFVALVARLPHPPADLLNSARLAWASLRHHNLGADGAIWNAWEILPNGNWRRREIRYAADQADLCAGIQGAMALGIEPRSWDPFAAFALGTLAMNETNQAIPVDEENALGAWAVLAFDGPPAWRREARTHLPLLSAGKTSVFALAAHAFSGEAKASKRLQAHLRKFNYPRAQEDGQGAISSNLAGFVLRALASEHGR
jgi:hypothetical protein